MAFERSFSLLLAIVCLVFLYLAWGFSAPIAYDPIGPRPYPLLIFGLLGLCCLIVAFRPAKFTKPLDLNFSSLIIRNLVLCAIVLLLYGVFFESLGFPIATALMTLAVGILFDGDLKLVGFFAIIFGIALYVLFDTLLEVKLPLGLLSDLM